MTDLAQRIYKILSPQEDFISVKSLAASLGLKDRDLRGKNGEPGILRTASKEIFIASGKCIIKRMSKPSGVKLTLIDGGSSFSDHPSGATLAAVRGRSPEAAHPRWKRPRSTSFDSASTRGSSTSSSWSPSSCWWRRACPRSSAPRPGRSGWSSTWAASIPPGSCTASSPSPSLWSAATTFCHWWCRCCGAGCVPAWCPTWATSRTS